MSGPVAALADSIVGTDSNTAQSVVINVNDPQPTTSGLAKIKSKNRVVKKKEIKNKENVYPCGEPTCCKAVPEDGDSLFCDFCKKWFHLTCTEVDKESFQFLSQTTHQIFWKCTVCPSLDEILSVDNKIDRLERRLENLFNNRLDKIETNISKKINTAYKVKDSAQVDKNVKGKLETGSKVSSVIVQKEIKLNEVDGKDVLTDIGETSQSQSPQITEKKIVQQKNDNIHSRPKMIAKICNHYRMGTCRHGASGKRLVENRECSYSHPPKCKNFCRYGSEGCDGNCGLLHPILCNSSLKFRECMNVNCSFAHLAGTKRSFTNSTHTRNSYKYNHTEFPPLQSNFRPLQNQSPPPSVEFPSPKNKKEGSFEEMAHGIKQIQNYLLRNGQRPEQDTGMKSHLYHHYPAQALQQKPFLDASNQHLIPSQPIHIDTKNFIPQSFTQHPIPNQHSHIENNNFLPYNQGFVQHLIPNQPTHLEAKNFQTQIQSFVP